MASPKCLRSLHILMATQTTLIILKPSYTVTRKSSVFYWGEAQQTLQLAQRLIHQTLSLAPPAPFSRLRHCLPPITHPGAYGLNTAPPGRLWASGPDSRPPPPPDIPPQNVKFWPLSFVRNRGPHENGACSLVYLHSYHVMD